MELIVAGVALSSNPDLPFVFIFFIYLPFKRRILLNEERIPI